MNLDFLPTSLNVLAETLSRRTAYIVIPSIQLMLVMLAHFSIILASHMIGS